MMFWRRDAQGCGAWFDAVWLEFVGGPVSTVADWSNLIHSRDVERYRSVVEDALERRVPFRIDYRLRRNDGVYRWVADAGAPLFGAAGFEGFSGACIDVTEYRLSRRAVMQERDLLVREVHHRVKNNMQTLMALVRFMRRSADEQGRVLLDTLNARLVSMTIVQRYLHATDNMMRVSMRALLTSLAQQLSETELAVDLRIEGASDDFRLAAPAAAYTGLAAAEAAVLLTQCGAPTISVALRSGEAPVIRIQGAARGADLAGAQLGMRLVRQYARGAGAATSVEQQPGFITLALDFIDAE